MGQGNVLDRLMPYDQLRIIIGLLGIALPVVLILWGFVICECTDMLPSISDYYYLRTRDALVGILMATGVFLFTYRGYPRDEKRDHKFLPTDNIVGHLACLFAIGVAFFPDRGSDFDQVVHFISAGGMFVMLSVFSFFLFTKTKDGEQPTPKKLLRNKIYRACGIIIWLCIILLLLNWALFEDTSLEDLNPVFWLEALALWSFGFSWFVKGGAFFKDA